MDDDDKYCGTCRHGELYMLCGICEDEEAVKDKNRQNEITHLRKLMEKAELCRNGHAAVNQAGEIVDGRENPDAVPIPKH